MAVLPSPSFLGGERGSTQRLGAAPSHGPAGAAPLRGQTPGQHSAALGHGGLRVGGSPDALRAARDLGVQVKILTLKTWEMVQNFKHTTGQSNTTYWQLNACAYPESCPAQLSKGLYQEQTAPPLPTSPHPPTPPIKTEAGNCREGALQAAREGGAWLLPQGEGEGHRAV